MSPVRTGLNSKIRLYAMGKFRYSGSKDNKSNGNKHSGQLLDSVKVDKPRPRWTRKLGDLSKQVKTVCQDVFCHVASLVPSVHSIRHLQKKGLRPAWLLKRIKHVKSVSCVDPCHFAPNVPSVVTDLPVGTSTPVFSRWKLRKQFVYHSKVGVGHIVGLQRLIFPHSHPSQVSQVHEVLSEQANLSVDCPSFQFDHSSIGVYKGETHDKS